MSVRDLAREARHSLESNRARSLLTILGIVIGIAAVIAMTSLIGGVRTALVDRLGLNAARAVYISCTRPLQPRDARDLARLMPQYESIEGSAFGFSETKTQDGTVYVNITGADGTFLTMTGSVRLEQGRLFTSREEQDAARVAIIDRAGVDALFGRQDVSAIGKTVRLGGRDYLIVGVDERMPQSGSASGSASITAYLPLKTVLADFGGGFASLSQVVGIAREGVDVDALMQGTKRQLAKIKGIPDDEVDDSVQVYSLKSQVDTTNSFMNSFSVIMGSVAGISLLVGGIGIMNMMLTNVTERYREIGVRRALGATRRDITMQFLMESAVLCAAGGIIGTVAGYLLSWGLSYAATAFGLIASIPGTEQTGAVAVVPLISVGAVAGAVGLSMAIGILFGFYPAHRAAGLDPVECLRHQ